MYIAKDLIVLAYPLYQTLNVVGTFEESVRKPEFGVSSLMLNIHWLTFWMTYLTLGIIDPLIGWLSLYWIIRYAILFYLYSSDHTKMIRKELCAPFASYLNKIKENNQDNIQDTWTHYYERAKSIIWKYKQPR